MRTPNTECILCGKPLYRRPSNIARARYAACISCRGRARVVAGITKAQQAGLGLGRPKGTNHRTGYHHREESKRKTSESNRRFWEAHPDLAIQRAASLRKPLSEKLNQYIRRMRENRRWMETVKKRDGRCLRCGSCDALEAHHKIELAELVVRFGITDRDDARAHAAVLWNIDNGETLCQSCHFAEHGRSLNGTRAYRRSRQRAVHAYIG